MEKRLCCGCRPGIGRISCHPFLGRGDSRAGGSKKTGCLVFHAGSMKKNGRYFVNGGRVLNVAAVAPTLKEAQDKAYEGVSKISWRGMQYRHDIADKGLKRLKKKIKRKSAVSVFDGDGAFICAYAGGYFWLVLLIWSFDIHLCLFLQAGNFMRSVYLPGT